MEDLARAVILKAIRDSVRRTVKYTGKENPTKKDKKEAINFLQGRGKYEIWLRFWCDVAGVNFMAVKCLGEKIASGEVKQNDLKTLFKADIKSFDGVDD